MAKVDPFHTILYEDPEVYHNDSDCPEGKKIKPEHVEKGIRGRLCEVCAKLERLAV